MAEQTWLPVRCCCTPTKVFGFLRVPSDALRVREIVIPDKGGVPQRVQLRKFTEGRCPTTVFDPDLVSVFTPPDCEIAVYSDDRPPEYWRGFEHFVAAVADE